MLTVLKWIVACWTVLAGLFMFALAIYGFVKERERLIAVLVLLAGLAFMACGGFLIAALLA